MVIETKLLNFNKNLPPPKKKKKTGPTITREDSLEHPAASKRRALHAPVPRILSGPFIIRVPFFLLFGFNKGIRK